MQVRAPTTLVREKLSENLSPQQISPVLSRTHPDEAGMRVCSETVHRALFDGLLGHRPGELRTGRARRRKQRRGVPSLNKIKNMTLIHQRPAGANDRKTAGHWEGDLVTGLGQGSTIGALVERTTRYISSSTFPMAGRHLRSAMPSPHRPLTCPNRCERRSPGTRDANSRSTGR